MDLNAINAQALVTKWQAVLEGAEFEKIKDHRRKQVTAVLLENQQKEYISKPDSVLLKESAPTNVTGGVAKYDPVLISMVRRAMPSLVAYDICGVQPMTGPTGLIFAFRSRYQSQAGPEALFNEADTAFSGTGNHDSVTDAASGLIGGNPVKDWAGGNGSSRYGYTTINGGIGRGMPTAQGEGSIAGQMALSIEKITVTAKTRVLAAEYSAELSQDMQRIHGNDAETELANILSTEIISEINREVIRTVNTVARQGCTGNSTSKNGIFDMSVDSDGRWSAEKFKGLLYQIDREANAILRSTRRGRGNFILCSADVASALGYAGRLDFAPALSTNLNVEEIGNSFVGILDGKYRVYIDPYFATTDDSQYVTVGYKGKVDYDAGLFYCPYIPLELVRAVNFHNMQPKIAFKTRYGLVENPFVPNNTGDLQVGKNIYYRTFKVTNLMG